jgi:undecaprenyl-diphosphatase
MGLAVAIVAIVLGLVEGITEYIPVSSTGHLILAGDLLGFDRLVGEEVAKTFDVFIQLGAILAVVVAYPGRFVGLLRLNDNRGFSGLRGLALLLVTSIPGGILGLVARRYIKDHLFNPLTVAIGLAVGALWILAVERLAKRCQEPFSPQDVGSEQDYSKKVSGAFSSPRREGVDSLGFRDALGIGLFQCLALWPGMSRSSSTILGGMMLGVERKTATEYSFFAAVPILTAATLFDLWKSRELLSAAHVPVFAIGFGVSFLAAWAAVKFFVRFLSRHTLEPFGWYRLAVAAAVLVWALRG